MDENTVAHTYTLLFNDILCQPVQADRQFSEQKKTAQFGKNDDRVGLVLAKQMLKSKPALGISCQ